MSGSQEWTDVMDRVRQGTTTDKDARYLEDVIAGYRALVEKLREGTLVELRGDVRGLVRG